MTAHRNWLILLLTCILLLSVSAFKVQIGFELRVGQFFALALFAVLLLHNFVHRNIDVKLLLFFFVFGLLLSLISLNSIYGKIGELKFIIKYMLLFPAIYYLGSQVFRVLNLKEVLNLIELSVLILCGVAVLLYYYPIPALMSPKMTFKGTFVETSNLATVIGLGLIASLSIRFQFRIWPEKRYRIALYYLFLLGCGMATANKSIWAGFAGVFVFIALYRTVVTLLHYRRMGRMTFMDAYRHVAPSIKKINLKMVFAAVAVAAVAFYLINAQLERPIISMEMLEHKLESERGKALTITLGLIRESSWLGGYGFGFVESYFSTARDGAIGLGEGVGMIFNSYLDAWLSVGPLGVVYHLLLVFFAYSSKYAFSMFIPVFLFAGANLNPATGNEFYYLFLGISYGMVHHFNASAAAQKGN